MILGNSEDYTKTFITVCFFKDYLLLNIVSKHLKSTIADDETLSNFVYAQKLNYLVLIRYIIVMLSIKDIQVWQRDNKKGMYLTLPKIRDFQVLQE